MTEHRLPKSEWGEGPWSSEPDSFVWVDKETGLTCQILRAPMTGALCGYVGLHHSHPAYGLHYDGMAQQEADAYHARWKDAMKRGLSLHDTVEAAGPRPGPVPGIGEQIQNIAVHGGLTWAGKWDKTAGNYWWYGFDCSHAGDLSPATDAMMRHLKIRGTTIEPDPRFKDVYRDMDYVRAECTTLAQQLKALDIDVSSFIGGEDGHKV